MPKLQPTKAQLALAEKVGLDIPNGVTRAGMTRSIDDFIERDRVERLSLHHVPNELVRRVSGYSTPSLSQIAHNSQLAKKIGLVTGCVAKKGEHLWAVANLDRTRVYAIALETDVAEGGWLNGFSLVYKPTQGYIHNFAATRIGMHCDERRSVREYVAKRMPTSDIYCNEHGVFWSKGRVDELIDQYLADREQAELSASQSKNKRARVEEVPEPCEKHCCTCGDVFIDLSDHHRTYRCDKCREAGAKLQAGRFCLRCGQRFEGVSNTKRCSPCTRIGGSTTLPGGTVTVVE